MGRKRSSGAEAMWRERLARFRDGDLTVAEFCRREGVSEPSFYGWRKRLRHGKRPVERRRRQQHRTTADVNKPSGFVPVHVSGLTATVLELPGGVTVRVPAASAEALRTAILAVGDAFGEVRPC